MNRTVVVSVATRPQLAAVWTVDHSGDRPVVRMSWTIGTPVPELAAAPPLERMAAVA